MYRFWLVPGVEFPEVYLIWPSLDRDDFKYFLGASIERAGWRLQYRHAQDYYMAESIGEFSTLDIARRQPLAKYVTDIESFPSTSI